MGLALGTWFKGSVDVIRVRLYTLCFLWVDCISDFMVASGIFNHVSTIPSPSQSPSQVQGIPGQLLSPHLTRSVLGLRTAGSHSAACLERVGQALSSRWDTGQAVGIAGSITFIVETQRHVSLPLSSYSESFNCQGQARCRQCQKFCSLT